MKPYPFSSLNHLTVPVAIVLFPPGKCVLRNAEGATRATTADAGTAFGRAFCSTLRREVYRRGGEYAGRALLSQRSPTQVRRTHERRGPGPTPRRSGVEGGEAAHRGEQRRGLRARAQGARRAGRRGGGAPARRRQAGREERAAAADSLVGLLATFHPKSAAADHRQA